MAHKMTAGTMDWMIQRHALLQSRGQYVHVVREPLVADAGLSGRGREGEIQHFHTANLTYVFMSEPIEEWLLCNHSRYTTPLHSLSPQTGRRNPAIANAVLKAVGSSRPFMLL